MAASIHSRLPKTAPALARAAIIMPFQSAMILSSRAGADALGARIEQKGTLLGEQRFVGVGERIAGDAAQPVQDVLSEEFAVVRDVVNVLEALGEGALQRCVDLGFAPDVIGPLGAFAVGVDAGGEGFFDAHVAQHPANRFGDAVAIERCAIVLPRHGQQHR